METMKKSVVSVVGGMVMGMIAMGQTWTGEEGNRLEDDGNWTGGVAPGEGATVNFPSGDYTLTTWTGFTNGIANVGTSGGGGGTITLDYDPALEWRVAEMSMRDGTFQINRGSFYNAGGVGFSADTRIVVDGAQSVFETTTAMNMITTGAKFIVRNGGQATLRGRIWPGDYALIEATGDDTVLAISNNDNTYIGGSYSTFRVTDGASSSGNNLVLGGLGNGIVITNGGTVSYATYVILGNGDGTGNTALIDGTNSMLAVTSHAGSLTVGLRGNGNVMTITNGAQVSAVAVYLGWGPDGNADAQGSENTLIVTGDESLLSVGHPLVIGGAGNGNEVRVTEGATAELGSYNVLIGRGGGTGNRLVVEAGATFSFPQEVNGAETHVGNTGSGNEMLIRDGGLFIMRRGILRIGNGGYGAVAGSGGSANLLEVSDGGHVLIGSSVGMGQGLDAAENILRVRNGTFEIAGDSVFGEDGTIYAQFGSRVEVLGTNSLLTTPRTLSLTQDSTLCFGLDGTPPVKTPVVIRDLTTDGTAKLEIDAKALAKAGGAKGVTLLEVSDLSASEDAFAQLEAAVEFVSGTGRVYVEGNALMLDIFTDARTIILVR